MDALAEYVGEERINTALRTLVETNASSLATTLDLYRELRAVTPDSLKPLLHTPWTPPTTLAPLGDPGDGQLLRLSALPNMLTTYLLLGVDRSENDVAHQGLGEFGCHAINHLLRYV